MTSTTPDVVAIADEAGIGPDPDGSGGSDPRQDYPGPSSRPPSSPSPRLSSTLSDLRGKWRRDGDLSWRLRVHKARRILVERARARLVLRHSESGARIRVIGKPRVEDHGTLIVGDDTVLRSVVAPIDIYVAPGATMKIGRDVRINSGATLAALSRIEIGNRVEIGPHVTVHDNSFHDLYDRDRVPESRPVVIEDDVWLASRATVLPGVRIGRGAVVVAHALVTRDVEPFTVVSGVPAVPVARLNKKKFVCKSDEPVAADPER